MAVGPLVRRNSEARVEAGGFDDTTHVSGAICGEKLTPQRGAFAQFGGSRLGDAGAVTRQQCGGVPDELLNVRDWRDPIVRRVESDPEAARVHRRGFGQRHWNDARVAAVGSGDDPQDGHDVLDPSDDRPTC